jgi:ABC-2 type transport system permease protein
LLSTFVRLNITSELAYRTNFLVQFVQSLLELGAALAGLAIVFTHTRMLGQWRPDELLVLLGVYFLVEGAINVMLQPSMQHLMEEIQQGTLDFTLVKPEDAQVLVSISRVRIWELVDGVLGLVVLSVALTRLGVTLRVGQVLAFGVTLIAGGVVLYSFWLLLATCAFWFVRVESMLAIFQNMYQAGRWPISIYPSWLRWLLTVLIPVGLVTTIPAEALVGRLSWEMVVGMVGLGMGMLVVSRMFWRVGVRYYTGASA